MNAEKLINSLKELKVFEGNRPVYIGMLPNDGQIIAGFPQAILSFDEENFYIYLFQGFVRLKYDNEKFVFKFSDIKEIELGKYNFKERYIKLSFDETHFVAFNYRFKVKGLESQKDNAAEFIRKLEEISQ